MTNLTTVQTDSVVVSLQRASTALAEARTIQQTKKILDVAAAAEVYARRQHLGEEIADQATAIKVEALRKLGEMLRAAPKAKGTAGTGDANVGRGTTGGVKASPPVEGPPTLTELGLTKRESAVAQKLAALPEEAFEQVRDGHTTITKAIAAVEASKPKPTVATPRPQPEPPSPVKMVEPPPAEPDGDPGDSLDQIVDELQRENAELLALVKVSEADDLKAEALRWKRSYDNAVREQSLSMDKAAAAVKREEWSARQLRRCGKAVNETNPEKIAAAVEAFVKQHAQVAA